MVGSLGVDALVVLDVHEGFVHYASEASMVTLLSGAVDQILFTQGNKLLGLVEVLTLQTASGREGPAAAAVTLILDRCNKALGSPVNLGWCKFSLGDKDGVCPGLLVHLVTIQHADKLISGEVVELILTNLEGQLTRPEGCVVLLHEIIVVLPDESSNTFDLIQILFTIPFFEILPQLVQLRPPKSGPGLSCCC